MDTSSNEIVNIIDGYITLYDEDVDFANLAPFLEIRKSLKICCKRFDFSKIPDYVTDLCLEIEFYDSLENLPQNLEFLIISSDSNRNYCETHLFCTLDNLPLSLKELHIELYDFNIPLEMLPEGLEVLKICSQTFNQTLDNLPKNLKWLEIWNAYNYGSSIDFDQPLLNLPQSIEDLFIQKPKGSYDNIKSYLPNIDIRYCG